MTTQEGPHGLMIEIGPGSTQDFTEIVINFKRRRGIQFVLAISGGADDDNPLLRHVAKKVERDSVPVEVREPMRELLETSRQDYIAGIIREILLPLRGYRIAIQTGGTTWGVPRVAVQIANELGFPTIGVFPLTAKGKHSLPLKMPPHLDKKQGAAQLDLAICVHPFLYKSQWGDESFIFTKMLDAAIVIGGGAGTMTEVVHILKLNERDDVPKKHIVPIHGTGGVADRLPFFPGKLDIMAECIPSMPIRTGHAAYEYLVNHNVLTEDIFEPEGEVA